MSGRRPTLDFTVQVDRNIFVSPGRETDIEIPNRPGLFGGKLELETSLVCSTKLPVLTSRLLGWKTVIS